jgi:hypothetical protein
LKVFENFVATLGGGGGMSSYFPGGTLRKKSLSSLGDGEELINSQPTQPRYGIVSLFAILSVIDD